MDFKPPREEEMSRLLGDEYAGRILSMTYARPMSVQEISKVCGIPIAVAYRRVNHMEEVGLVRCVKEEEVYRGKKVKLYRCAVRAVVLAFKEGRFSVEVDPMPADEYEQDEMGAQDMSAYTNGA
jgi:predicted transcriptional regulator